MFLAAGMGGGTGTGATPIIARELKRLDPSLLIVAVVTKYEQSSTRLFILIIILSYFLFIKF